jgi:hypothetical protein
VDASVKHNKICPSCKDFGTTLKRARRQAKQNQKGTNAAPLTLKSDLLQGIFALFVLRSRSTLNVPDHNRLDPSQTEAPQTVCQFLIPKSRRILALSSHSCSTSYEAAGSLI